jgi:TetR/AcrR family transcriptional repressor of mexJK operon
MKAVAETHSDRKHQSMVDAARRLFLEQGYEGTSMEQIAVKAGVSKQTVYKHFADKQKLFSEIVLATTSQVDRIVGLIAGPMVETRDLKRDLTLLGRQFIAELMHPPVLRLRRLVIANADRMPDLGRTWYEQGFERVLGTLAATFAALSRRRLLSVEDPLIAAHHFVGLLLWIPVNRAMFTGNEEPYTKAALDRYADSAVRAFLAAYAAKGKAGTTSAR